MKRSLLTALTVVAGVASAAEYTWVGGTSGSWGNAANWNPSGVPTKGDTASFIGEGETPSDCVTVTLDGDRELNTLVVENIEGVTFRGGESVCTMTMWSDSKGTLKVPLTFEKDVQLAFASGKQWNNDGGLISLFGGLRSDANPHLTQGTYVIEGLVELSKGMKISSTTIDFRSDVSSVSNALTCSNSTFAPTGRPIKDMPASLTGSPALGGTAPLAFDCGGEKPDIMINRWANVAEPIYRTFPVSISWFALCSSATDINNAAVGFLPGSGSRLELTGDLTSVASKDDIVITDTDESHGALRLSFRGCGASVLMTGSKNIQAVAPYSTAISHTDGVGYNAIELAAGPDGVKTIRPFGNGALYANDGHGVFLAAREPGLTLDNGMIYGNSVQNRNGYTFGFDGTNAMIVSGAIKMGTGASKFPQLAEAPLTFTGAFNPMTTALDFVGTGDVILESTVTVGGTTGRVSKHSAGTLTWRGTMTGSSYNKGYFAGGRTVFDYTENETSRLNTANSETALADALRLRGTELVLKGGAVAESVGEGNGTTFQNGFTRIRRENGASTIYLGKISPSATSSAGYTGSVDMQSGVAMVDMELAGKNLAGNFTVDGTHFAAVDEDGAVVAAPDSLAHKITGSVSSGRAVASYIIIEPSEAGQAWTWNGTSDGAFVANSNGIIFRGPYDYAIEGGWLAGAATYNSALTFRCAGTGVVTYNGKLDRYGFSKTGPGTFRYTGESDLDQSLNIYEGVFEVASATAFSPSAKSNYKVNVDGGTLRTTVDVSLERPLDFGDNGGVIEVADGTVFTVAAAVETAGVAESTSGPMVKKGAGTLILAGDMTAQSEVDLVEGTIKLEHEWGLGCSTNRTRAIAPTKIKGGVLDVAGFKAHLGNVYLRGGTIIDSSAEGTGSLGAYTFWAENGTVNVPLTNVKNPCASNGFIANDLEKITEGTVTLTAANEFTGTAFVRAGTLNLTGSLAGSAWVEGGELTGTGTIDGYVYITKNGTLAPAMGATMMLNDNLAVGEGGTLAIAADATNVSKITLTRGNLYLGEDAQLAFSLSGRGLGALKGTHVIVEIPEGGFVDGAFANFPGDKYIDAHGNKYHISYTAGDGNDVGITATGTGFSIIVR